MLVTGLAEAPIAVRQQGEVLAIELRRPDALNALTVQLGNELVAALDHANDPGIGCVLLTGAGRAFSAGADLKDLEGPKLNSGAPDLERALRECFNRPVRQIRDLPKPVVAALNGPAVGIAVSYALACDVVLAAESSYLLTPFTTVGLVPDGGASCLVPARAGFGRYNRLMFGAERLPARLAMDWGLVDSVLPDATFLQEAHALCDRLSRGATQAYASIKRTVNEGVLAGLDAALDLEARLQGRQAESAEFATAIARFAARPR
ncbi:hypothetical protein B8W69_28705 [Mycobacterium vulneris]|uniref:Enoyl-CoA hydratase n=1 Tax=Mycolicibacterium vulneris TaxID=547163 RepID=A0A1X2KI45_9MYCO|nr:enoyl-CoA hydratase-related protein [Mycolicibacterium vulneris]OSC21197.1 hypothetical protein B8W69_28705 [Mycolicibacterium vulneris]